MSENLISLPDCFSSVPDPRVASGKRHPLEAILTLCSVAMLCGSRSLFAIARFGRDRGKHFAHQAGIVLRQIPVDARTNEHKAALEMLDLIPIKGKLVTGDAMFCQRDLSRKIRSKQGHYLWPVKDNQPDMLAAIEDAFDDTDTSPSAAGVG